MQSLIDSFGRIHNYLRLSLTHHCNFKCSYCMPHGNSILYPSKAIMGPEEIDTIVNTFCKLDVNKIRLTGEKSLIRKDVADIIKRVSEYPVSLSLSTNGARLHCFIDTLIQSKVKSINLSLGCLKEQRFFLMTKSNLFKRVWNNIQLVPECGFAIKLDMVVFGGINDDEIIDFVDLTKNRNIEVWFIEFMPFTGNNWDSMKEVPKTAILEKTSCVYTSQSKPTNINDTTEHFRIPGFMGSFATICTMSHPFCGGCNRIRLPAGGKMKNCLFSQDDTDLLTPFRNGLDILLLIRHSILNKAASTGDQLKPDMTAILPSSLQNRSMVNIGG